MSLIQFSPAYLNFLDNLKERIASARYQAARTVNRELILLYHHIGTEILRRQQEQGLGSKVILFLHRDLSAAFPEMRGFSTRNLKYMRLSAQEYPDLEFVQQVAAQLTWYYAFTSLNIVRGCEV